MFVDGEPSTDGAESGVPADDLRTVLLPTEIQVGNLPPGTHLQERYEIMGVVARQADRATYRIYDHKRCHACGSRLAVRAQAGGQGEQSDAKEHPLCPKCGAVLSRSPTALLDEWLTEPESPGAQDTFEHGGRLFTMTLEEPPQEEGAFPCGVRLVVGARSVRGPDLATNQDSLLTLTLAPMYEGRSAPALGLFAVADGIGGHEGGEVASRIAVQVLAQEIVSGMLLAELGGDACLDETLTDIVGEAIMDANAQVYAVARGCGSDMGSTLTAVLVRGNLAIIANVGDSRTYHWHDGALRQLTTDHSVVERLVAMGVIDSREAAAHPQRGVLYRSLGDRAGVEVDVLSLQLSPSDRLLLCCDGVWENLDDGLEKVMRSEPEPQRACDEIARRALEAGASDNVSVIVVGVLEA
jgi:serine/threonine protein phosphatase PrpC